MEMEIEPKAPARDNIIKEGDVVILLTHDNQSRITPPIKPRLQTSISKKKKVNIDSLIGKQWGSTFEVNDGKLIQIPFIPLLDSEKPENKIEQPAAENEEEGEEDNSDQEPETGENKTDGVQKLSQKKILDMKKKGVSGNQIVKALTENSATFQEKSEFAKQKYINKKSRKHLLFCTAVKPTALSLIQAYFQSKPERICYLRSDSLAELLLFSNVQATSRVLVADGGVGILLGAITERTGGIGRIVNVYTTQQPVIDGLKLFNFPQSVLDTVQQYPMEDLLVLRKKIIADKNESKDISNSKQEEISENEKPKEDKKKDIENFLIEQVDSLVIAGKVDPNSMLMALFPFLAPGKPFAVFSQYIQPLADAQEILFKQGTAVNMDIQETWMREYQVLPSRTHPMMRMHGASGYILYGTKVNNDKGVKRQKTK